MTTRTITLVLLGSLLPFTAVAEKPRSVSNDTASGFFKSLVPHDPGTAPLLDRGDVQSLMSSRDPIADWMNSRVESASDDPGGFRLNEPHAGGSRAFSHLDWRATGGMRGLINDYNALGDSIKARVFGKSLSRKLEIELDGSPEIKYKVEFD